MMEISEKKEPRSPDRWPHCLLPATQETVPFIRSLAIFRLLLEQAQKEPGEWG
jgi:hypothetical protein